MTPLGTLVNAGSHQVGDLGTERRRRTPVNECSLEIAIVRLIAEFFDGPRRRRDRRGITQPRAVQVGGEILVIIEPLDQILTQRSVLLEAIASVFHELLGPIESVDGLAELPAKQQVARRFRTEAHLAERRREQLNQFPEWGTGKVRLGIRSNGITRSVWRNADGSLGLAPRLRRKT